LPKSRATRAILELALLLRLLDDEEGVSEYFASTSRISFGRLVKADGSEASLTLRDVCNKIIHASGLEWQLATGPVLICNSQEPQRWAKAEIDLDRLAAFCGQLLA
jgi:hypothetical protein